MLPRIIYIKLSQASVLLPIFTGLANYKRLTSPFRVLLYFFLASILFEIQASVLGKLYHNNMPGLHLFVLVEFLVFSTVYYQHFQKNSVLRLFIGINTIVFIAVALTDALLINSIWVPNTLSRSYSSVSMICYTLVYFYFMFSKDATQYNAQHPMFWITIGALIYFGSNTLYFMLTSYLINRAANTAMISMVFHGMINIIANCLYAQSFRCFRKQTAA